MSRRLPDLIGRAMIDAEFLADLQRAPETVLAEYELTEAERAAVRAALGRLDGTPSHQQAQALKAVLLRRIAT